MNQRDRAIPPPVVAVNRAALNAIAAYSAAKGVAHSPWLYYKLVNVQAYPFDKAEVVPDPNSPRNAATFHLANVVVETNYALQNFSGRIAPNNAPTDYAKAGQWPLRNTYILDGGRLRALYNMGGCVGCHANAQSGEGSDFSFILGDRPTTRPESPPQLLDTKVHSERQRRLSNLSPPE